MRITCGQQFLLVHMRTSNKSVDFFALLAFVVHTGLNLSLLLCCLSLVFLPACRLRWRPQKAAHQPTNQPTNQPIHPPTNQPTNQPTNPPTYSSTRTTNNHARGRRTTNEQKGRKRPPSWLLFASLFVRLDFIREGFVVRAQVGGRSRHATPRFQTSCWLVWLGGTAGVFTNVLVCSCLVGVGSSPT